nr:integrase, catalytic region, zinc finger, CCHC-type, peptidase aspartic, catalytic [Tanacetum cinerariifolium]
MWMRKGSSNIVKANLSSVNHSNLNKNVKRYSRKNLMACNNSDTCSGFDCNNARNALCNARMNASVDVNDLFIFDDVSIRKSYVSKMPFRKKPRDSLNVRSKSNSNKSLPRTVHKWLPKLQPLAEPVAKWIPRIVQICLWIIDSGCSKHMTGNRALLTNFVEKFLGTVRFGNNDFALIAGYGDVIIGSMTIKKVYYVEGFGHNLFSIGQFSDKGLEVTFQKTTCFVRNEDGVDLLTGDRSSNFYTIALNEVASNSLTCLLEKASSSQSWLWHQRISHLNFATINNLVKNNLVQGLPMMKFEKDHLCSACKQGKIHRKHHKSKMDFASNKLLYLLHMDLCGPMRVESINGKRYVLVVVDDYSRTPQQNGVVERRNQTLVEAARTMLTFANLPLFLWAEAIAITCFTQNHLIIHKRFNKTPYEIMNKRKPNIKFFHNLAEVNNLNINHNAYMASASQIHYAPIAHHPSELSSPKTGLVVPVFQKGDDPIDAINHMMPFLTSVVTSRVTIQAIQGRQNHMSAGSSRPFASGSGGTSRRQRVALMANLSHYGSDNLAEVINQNNMPTHLIPQEMQVPLTSKQSTILAQSNTEKYEYVTISGCCAQVLGMRTQLTDYGFFYDRVSIYCDSKSAIAISCNPVQHTQTKYIDVRYHFIKDNVEKGTIELYFVGTEYQHVDLFTKSLPEARFRFKLLKRSSKIAFENADSSSRVELIPSKIKYAIKAVLSFHNEFSVFSSISRKENNGLLQDQVFKNKEEVVINVIPLRIFLEQRIASIKGYRGGSGG